MESSRTVGGQPGNDNAKRGRRYRDAIRRELAKRYGSVDAGYEAIAAKLIDKCDEGDLGALKEAGDREDGKPQQAIVGDDDAPPVNIRGVIDLVRPG